MIEPRSNIKGLFNFTHNAFIHQYDLKIVDGKFD